MSNKNVNLSVCLPFIGPNCMHEWSGCRLGPTFAVNALNFSWVAYYGNDHPMQQAYSILVQSEISYMRSPYRHYADFYIS